MKAVRKLRSWWSPADDTAVPHPIEPVQDTTRPLRFAIALLAIGLFGFFAWAMFAPLDQGVPTQGLVIVDTKRKTIQHLSGGIIEKVNVREGQWVNANDVLIELNDRAARASFEASRQRYLSLRATEGRLRAEQTNMDNIQFHPDVLSGQNDPTVRQHVLAQVQLLKSRRQALRGEIAALSESQASQEEAGRGYAAQLEARRQQLALLKEETDNMRGLVSDGYVARNKLLELERQAAELSATLGDLQASQSRSRLAVSELSIRKLQRTQEQRKEVDTQLADVLRDVAAEEERTHALREEFERTRIRAPVSGAVVGIATQTIGGVIPPGTRIMDVVPKDETLMLEAHVAPHLIDKVKPGQLADIRFSTFSQTPQLVAEGKLQSVSADLLTDSSTNTSYYLARVTVTPQGLRDLGAHQLQPGMPAEIIIKTGERTLINYLLAPLLRRIAQGMKEE